MGIADMDAHGERPDHRLMEGDVNFSPRRNAWQAEAIDEASKRWLDADARVFLHQSLSTPCLDVLDACEGIYLQDLQGRRIMDFHGNSVHQVGFRHPRVVEAVHRQLDALPFCTRRYTNRPAIELAQRLASLAPGRLNRVLFAPGGAEAIGIALKLARLATGRFKTISMWDSFHGASLDAISIGGEAMFRRGIGPLLPGTEHAPPPNPRACLFGCEGACRLRCADYIEYMLEREGDVGAIVAEPIRCTTAVPPPPGYWERIRELCDWHGALLIFDEIPTSLGRTGRLFASETVGVTPDILVMGKALGGGIVPMAAVIVREDLAVPAESSLGHYTHEKSPLGAAAGLAALNVIEEENLLEHSRAQGALALERLRALQTQYPLIADVRGTGLLMGVELVCENGAPAVDEADAIMYSALRAGLNFKVSGGNVLTLTPPLIITADEMDRALAILERCLAEVCSSAVDIHQNRPV